MNLMPDTRSVHTCHDISSCSKKPSTLCATPNEIGNMLGQCGDADEPHAGSQQEIVRSSQGIAICELLRQGVEGPLPFMPELKMYGFQGKARSGDCWPTWFQLEWRP